MDTQSLQAFLAVADSGSFSRAAEQLHLTQPAVSKRIASLEALTRARLFDRIGRRVSLTEAGRLLLPRARQILVMVDDSRRALSNLSDEVSGELTLATSHHIGLHRLPPVLGSYVKRYPEVRLDLRFLDSEQAYQGVLDGDIEVALVTLSAHPDPQLRATRVWVDDMTFVAAPEHPLARESRVTLATLCEHDALLPGPLTFTRQLILERLARHGLAPRVGQSTNYLETLKMMASAGLGWSLLPDPMVERDIASQRLVRLALEEPAIQRPLGYLVHRDRTLSNAARSLLECLDQEAVANPASP
ncbi:MULTISPECIES: LysR family transcriptional regulator [unclassified Halomonas]|uniref:LysR family transcriptional regulator n=1 Tax=unclassified Halomonas TaxID=2609666 RepID=UPI0005FA8BD6|nr:MULTISPECIES: LysR family transcriptional regulator [unclassified Halomonas]KJZ14939.1 LysR family transcriptional regulator [Halomonas sp. S2151]MCJ8287441.1 LysR family transcriptional regulator [Halomonas sp.]NQY72161.1 LysR family transcriptional regulator [Halomonas sp.]